MPDSTTICMEAQKFAIDLQNHSIIDSLTNLDLSNIQPPSEIDCISFSTVSYNSPDTCNPQMCKTKRVLSYIIKRKSAENLTSLDHNNIDSIKPPTVMNELLDSMTSVDSIKSEIADTQTMLSTLNTHSRDVELIKNHETIHQFIFNPPKLPTLQSNICINESNKNSYSKGDTTRAQERRFSDRFKTYTIANHIINSGQNQNNEMSNENRNVDLTFLNKTSSNDSIKHEYDQKFSNFQVNTNISDKLDGMKNGDYNNKSEKNLFVRNNEKTQSSSDSMQTEKLNTLCHVSKSLVKTPIRTIASHQVKTVSKKHVEKINKSDSKFLGRKSSFRKNIEGSCTESEIKGKTNNLNDSLSSCDKQQNRPHITKRQNTFIKENSSNLKLPIVTSTVVTKKQHVMLRSIPKTDLVDNNISSKIQIPRVRSTSVVGKTTSLKASQNINTAAKRKNSIKMKHSCEDNTSVPKTNRPKSMKSELKEKISLSKDSREFNGIRQKTVMSRVMKNPVNIIKKSICEESSVASTEHLRKNIIE